jgi:hypothetical protein
MTGSTPTVGAGSPSGDRSGASLALVHAGPGPIIGASPVIGLGGTRAAGVALRLAGCAEDLFEIALVDRHGNGLMVLGRFAEEDVVACWRRLGATSGLPLMIEPVEGFVEAPFPQIGRLRVGSVQVRRRYGPLNQRPRFLRRRKPARLPHRPTVHRERELTGGGI